MIGEGHIEENKNSNKQAVNFKQHNNQKSASNNDRYNNQPENNDKKPKTYLYCAN